MTRHLWAKVGAAWSKVTLHFGESPFSSKVHTPLGPRKSGIPDEVLIPAPVQQYYKLILQTNAFTNCSVNITCNF